MRDAHELAPRHCPDPGADGSRRCLVFLAPTDRMLRGRISVLGCAAALTVLGAVLLFEVWLYGPIAGDMGSWPAPFGITLVADLFSARSWC